MTTPEAVAILKENKQAALNVGDNTLAALMHCVVELTNTLLLAPPAIPKRQEKEPLPAAVGARWTPEEDELLRQHFNSGLSIEEIATLHNRKKGGVRARLIKLSLINL